jgi:hypothetical protein
MEILPFAHEMSVTLNCSQNGQVIISFNIYYKLGLKKAVEYLYLSILSK